MRKKTKLTGLPLIALLLISSLAACGTKAKKPGRIGIIGAMNEEVASLISELDKAKKTTVAGMEFDE